MTLIMSRSLLPPQPNGLPLAAEVEEGPDKKLSGQSTESGSRQDPVNRVIQVTRPGRPGTTLPDWVLEAESVERPRVRVVRVAEGRLSRGHFEQSVWRIEQGAPK